jgi:hypothetical protein
MVQYRGIFGYEYAPRARGANGTSELFGGGECYELESNGEH